jgi:hypothetical protein
MDLINNKIIPIIYMLGVLLLVLPGFLNKNSKIKTLFQNFGIWFAIILLLLSFMYFIEII